MVRVLLEFVGREFLELCLDLDQVLPGARPVRLATRKMCVSTAIAGTPNAVLSTTLAVLRPTPGSASSASRLCGTSPLCRARELPTARRRSSPSC